MALKNKIKLKKGDQVIVISGKDKGKTGEVLKVEAKKQRLVVAGVNVAKKHQKPSMTSQGGIVDKNLSLHISNLAYLDPKEEKPAKVGFKILEDGKKVRFSRKTGEVI